MYVALVLPAARDYDALYRSFRWQVPEHYNIGIDICDRWAEIAPDRTAILDMAADARSTRSATARCARAQTGWPTCSPHAASSVAIGLQSCCRNRRRSFCVTSPFTNSVLLRCRWRCCSAEQ
jgi:hypothetical protein